MWWYKYVPLLEDVIRNHFPDATPDQVRETSNSLYDGWRTASALQHIERSNKPSSVDADAIRQAAKQLRRAVKSLGKVGWHGSEALMPLAERLLSFDHPATPFVAKTEAASLVAESISRLADDLENAATRLPSDAPPVFDYLGEGRKTGRPAETEAFFTARECTSAFKRLAGERPTIATGYLGEAGGRYIEFVASVFAALDIRASVEASARAALSRVRTH